MPLMFSIAQMSRWSPKALGGTGLKAMQERGRLQVGKVADITIFDPLKAMAESTFKQGVQGRPTSGIPYVVVNGQPKPGINDRGIPGTHAGHSHGKDSGEQAAEDPGAGEKK